MTNKIKMSEEAFVAGADLARIIIAESTLRWISNNPCVSSEDYKTVMTILSKWSGDISNSIETE